MQGERGINLSGGQKARVSLARACYSRSSLVLLDDPLAAVDVPTARFLMDHVLAGILKSRTVILVTHNKTSLSFCDRVLLMDHGRLQELPKEALLAGEVAAVLFDEPETTHGHVINMVSYMGYGGVIWLIFLIGCLYLFGVWLGEIKEQTP